MIFDTPHFIQNDGFRLATYSAGPKDGLPLILVHGWPEIAYSWKNQIEPLSSAGYRVITYDLRGFGRSDTPKNPTHYGIAQMVSDLEAVSRAYCDQPPVIIGHDWGGIIVWQAAMMLGPQVRGVASICTPLVNVAPVDPIEIFKKRFGDAHYFVHFNERFGVADRLFAKDPRGFFRMMFRSTPKGAVAGPDFAHFPKHFKKFLKAGAGKQKGQVMSDADLQVYADTYAASGFHGGHNLYRNTTENWKLTKDLPLHVSQPSLMLSPEDDLMLPPAMADHMPKIIPDLERQTIPDCGHWAMWEQPEIVNRFLLEWLGRRF